MDLQDPAVEETPISVCEKEDTIVFSTEWLIYFSHSIQEICMRQDLSSVVLYCHDLKPQCWYMFAHIEYGLQEDPLNKVKFSVNKSLHFVRFSIAADYTPMLYLLFGLLILKKTLKIAQIMFTLRKSHSFNFKASTLCQRTQCTLIKVNVLLMPTGINFPGFVSIFPCFFLFFSLFGKAPKCGDFSQ